MEGHFLVDCYDGAFAEAHVAVLDFQVDIVKAFVCFKGHINYNLNILKVLIYANHGPVVQN